MSQGVLNVYVYVLEVLKYAIISKYIIKLNPSYSLKRYLIVPVVLMLGLVSYVAMDENQFGIYIILLIAMIFMCFSENVRLSTTFTVLIFVAVSFMDLLAWLLCVGLIPYGSDYKTYENILTFFGNLVGLIPWLSLILILKKSRTTIRDHIAQIRFRSYILIVLIIISLIIVTACMQGAFLGDIEIDAQRLIMIISFMFCVFVIVLCTLYVYSIDTRNTLKEINVLNTECIEYQKNYYTSVMKKDEELRAFRHDVSKHYQALQALCEDKDIDAIRKYLESMGSVVNTEKVYKTGNVIADYIISGKIKEIKDKAPNTKIDIVGKFPQQMKLDNTEVCIVIANILDNAKDAIIEFEGDRSLFIEIKNYKDNLFLTIKNSSNFRSEDNKTLKSDKENHGFGLKNVRRIVEKYKGNMSTHWQNCTYITEIRV